MKFTAQSAEDPRPVMGALLLSSDETLEQDLRADISAADAIVHSARVQSAAEVSTETLGAMAQTLTDGAAQLPGAPTYSVIGYGCTSATAVMGSARVAELVRAGRACTAVTTPLDALVAFARSKGLTRLALLSPYVEEVSQTLRTALAAHGIETPAFGSFDEPTESAVVRISCESIVAAGRALVASDKVDGLFLSCTNLPTRAARPILEEELGLPVMASNSVLAWHMRALAGLSNAH